MDALSIQMFGGLQLQRNGTELPPFPTRKAAALFSCLVLQHGDCVPRNALCARLWGDQPDRSARKSLRNALWRVRQILEPNRPGGDHYLRIDADRVGFRPTERTVVDVWEFLAVAERFDAEPLDLELSDGDVADIERATALYRGRLLDGESIVDDATVIEAERLELLQISLLERLLLHHRRRENWRAAASNGHHILRLDNCREHVHREVMACYFGMGDRPGAIRQFNTCADILDRELGIEPMRETFDLIDRIRTGEFCPTTDARFRMPAIGSAWA